MESHHGPQGPANVLSLLHDPNPVLRSLQLLMACSVICALSMSAAFGVDVAEVDGLHPIIVQLENNERSADVLSLTQVEDITDFDNPRASVRRTIVELRDGDRYRVEIDYPSLDGPPARTDQDETIRIAYIPVLSAKDISGVSYLLPSAGHGIVAKDRPLALVDAFPVTNIRPLWPYTNEPLSSYIVGEVSRPGAAVSVDGSASDGEVVVEIEYGRRRRRLTLDGGRDYVPVKIEMYYDGMVTDVRNFDEYQRQGSVWMATRVDVRMYRSADQTIGRMHQFQVESWALPAELDDRLFRVTFPEGAVVRDYNTSMSYQVVADAVIDESMMAIVPEAVGAITVPEGYQVVQRMRPAAAAEDAGDGVGNSGVEEGGHNIAALLFICAGAGLVAVTLAYARVKQRGVSQ